MNDRLKFRYWDKNKKEYIKTQCHCLALHWSSFVSVWCAQRDNGTYSTRLGEIYNDMDIIPEQCTGLKDKNGNLIYEGDILLLCNNKFEVGHNNITVFFKCLTDKYTHIDPMDFDYDESEIIGNIHEQAEQKDVK